MSRPGPERGGSESGYALVALVVTVTVMMVMLTAAVPSWRYLMKDSREEELLFRGKQIADAIQRYQKKNANAVPPSLDVLVKGKYLRKAYKDPMTKDGKWRFIRQGEVTAGGQPATPPGGVAPGGRSGTTPTTTQPARPGGGTGAGGSGGTIGGTVGAIYGVASTSTEASLRIVNGRSKYSEWLFVPGQPLIVGQQQSVPGVVNPGGLPGTTPSSTPAAPPLPR
jgi:type II secretory pathway pseudopilin PulG